MSRPAHVWTPEWDARILALRAEGLTIKQVAARIGRSHESVRLRFSRIADGSSGRPKPLVVRARSCLCCGQPMRSTGAHHRMCDPCRHGNGLPPQWQGGR